MNDYFENKCAVVRDLLPIYADHGTSPETSSLVSQHISKCEECSKYLSYIRKSNEKKRNEIHSEATPDYLGFLKQLRKKRNMDHAMVASALVISFAALIASALLATPANK